MKISIATIIGMAMVLIGAYLFGSSESPAEIIIALALLLSGVYILYYIITKKYQEDQFDKITDSMAEAQVNADAKLKEADDDHDIYCRDCGAAMSLETKYCPDCGAKMPLDVCRKCGNKLENNVKFCDECGTKTDIDHN